MGKGSIYSPFTPQMSNHERILRSSTELHLQRRSKGHGVPSRGVCVSLQVCPRCFLRGCIPRGAIKMLITSDFGVRVRDLAIHEFQGESATNKHRRVGEQVPVWRNTTSSERQED